VDADRDALAGGLVTGDALDVDHVLEAVHRGDLALLVLVDAADDLDLVVLADGDAPDLLGVESATDRAAEVLRKGARTYVVFLTELLAERGAHDAAADARGSGKVRLARLAPRRRNS
jgi:hypothetical protein